MIHENGNAESPSWIDVPENEQYRSRFREVMTRSVDVGTNLKIPVRKLIIISGTTKLRDLIRVIDGSMKLSEALSFILHTSTTINTCFFFKHSRNYKLNNHLESF